MKAKKTARILCALSAAALCVSCISATAFATSYNGEDHGTVWLNKKEYSFTTRLCKDLSAGGYYSYCYTPAALVRAHQTVYGTWDTKNYGFVTAFGGSFVTEHGWIGASTSKTVTCPKGVSQILKYAEANANITLWGDVAVTSELYFKSN